MERDITDFSARDDKKFRESVSLYESALEATDDVLLNFDNARRTEDEIPTEFTEKTHNSKDFLNEEKMARRKMNENTSAIAELIAKRKFSEELMFGATQADLENEVRGDLGREILQICKDHNITGKAIWEAMDTLKDIVGTNPNVEEALESWEGGSQLTPDEEPEDEEETDDSEEDFAEEDDDSTSDDFSENVEKPFLRISRDMQRESRRRR